MNNVFFPQKPSSYPIVYAYEDNHPQYRGFLKIGFTTRSIEDRMSEHYPTLMPGEKPYKVLWSDTAMYSDGGNFKDYQIFDYLKKHGFQRINGEWYKCTLDDVKAAYVSVKNHNEYEFSRINDFKMRPEQEAAVNKTFNYFNSIKAEGNKSTPRFLWNAKMRFGKTFAAYELAKKMGFKRILILTFKPAVQNAWEEDLLTHVDFEGWQFICRGGLTFEKADKNKPIVCFGSFQDYLGVNKETGGIKSKNEWVHTEQWDLVIFDEYHFGAWRDSAKKLFEEQNDEDIENIKEDEESSGDLLDETWLPITSYYYLYLSGTPFRAINSGEFIEDQVYSWTYSDEQNAKLSWKGSNNPYESLPRMVMLTYQIPEAIRKVATSSEFNEFDINMFFSAEGKKDEAHFVYENEVQKWLDLIRGQYINNSIDEIKVGTRKGQSLLPFKEVSLLNVLSHTLWFLPNVASCYAMANLLKENQNTFYHDYKVIICAGPEAGNGADALKPVLEAMDNPLKTKTITLSCGKLTTGVTVRPWTGIFMLRNLSSPETYFQSAFRVQSPWVISDENNNKIILKKECYIFDFALNRALKQIADYSCKLDVSETNPEKKVEDFVHFLPVLAYDDGAMREINAAEILDIAMSGTSATLLAKRWESALLVNVDNATLERLLNNPAAMAALMNIEGFRSLNKDITQIIAKSNDVKKAKKENSKLNPKEKKILTEEEKEYKSKRKQIQEKLIKFATRIPIFMYLTDFREYTLKDVITKLEPGLFKKVTGLSVNDFSLLESLGIFNGPLMNDAVYKFKRYEDSSLSYSGISMHKGEKVGGYDTVLTEEEYNSLYNEQQLTLISTTSEKDIKKSFNNSFETKSITESNLENDKNVNRDNHKVIVIQKKEIEELDLSKIIVGAKVTHKAFGEGHIVSILDDCINIKFENYAKEKTFEYPSSFYNGFLKLIS